MDRPRPSRNLLVLGSIVAVVVVGLLAYWTIALSLGCAEHDSEFFQQKCPNWFKGRSTSGTLVMLCAYFGPLVTLIAAIATVVSRRARYVVTASVVVSIPMVVLFLAWEL